MKVAFLDRDGTIISDYTDEQWSSIEEPEFLEGSISGLKGIQNLGFDLIIVTNQYLIGEGFITNELYKDFTMRMLSVLASNGIKVLDIFYCPHRRDSNCQCLKPRPGMIHQALNKYSNICLGDSFLVGDSVSDIELADSFKMRSFSFRFNHPGERSKRVESLIQIPEILK